MPSRIQYVSSERATRHRKIVRRILPRDCVVINVDQFSAQPAARLRAGVRPSAVARFVIAVVVDAVKGCVGRARPEFPKKRFKVVAPFRAHCDASSSIASIVWMDWIKAPLFGVYPSHALDRLMTTTQVAVFSFALSSLLFVQTPTTPRVTASERMATHDGKVAAIAITEPRRTTKMLSLSTDDKSAKSFTQQAQCGHSNILSPENS